MKVHESENRWKIEMQDCLVMEDVWENNEILDTSAIWQVFIFPKD